MDVAVVGTGIAGLATAWLLASAHRVDVFEREPRLGGHTHTMAVEAGRARTSAANLGALTPVAAGPPAARRPVAVDTGFIVYNEVTYPHLTRLFDVLGVTTAPSDMSWSLRCDRCDLEYAGNLRGILAQPSNLARPSYARFLTDLARFNRLGRRLADDPRAARVPLGRFLRQAGFGHGLRHHYVLPMAAAIWSSGTATVEDFPLGTLLAFFRNHGLLGVRSQHPWRTVAGGASSYVPELVRGLDGRVRLDDPVVAVSRDDVGAEVHTASGTRQRFDAVVLATHADEALRLLVDPSPREKELLGAWEYSTNDVWLHTDTAVLPNRRAAWAAWNYRLADCHEPLPRASLSYHMNRLQPLETDTDFVVTVNPQPRPDPGRVLRRLVYRHPAYTRSSVATQPALDEINGPRRTFFAGAYHRYGFHEDGLWSALRVARHLGVDPAERGLAGSP